MMDPTMVIPMAIVLAAAEAIIEAAVMIAVTAARSLMMRVMWSMTRVRKRVVMAMMMWVRGVTVRSPVMQRG